jgi:hypothetical protein
MKMGMRGLINLDDCLRYSLISLVIVSMFGVKTLTLSLKKIGFIQPLSFLKIEFFQQSIETEFISVSFFHLSCLMETR